MLLHQKAQRRYKSQMMRNERAFLYCNEATVKIFYVNLYKNGMIFCKLKTVAGMMRNHRVVVAPSPAPESGVASVKMSTKIN